MIKVTVFADGNSSINFQYTTLLSTLNGINNLKIKEAMFKNLTLTVFLCISSLVYSQNVGINTTGAIPSKNAILDLNTGNSYNTGLIIPHVTLGASLSTFSPPIASAVTINDTGMIVYNMNGAQTVGYYCWNGSSWVSVSGSAANTWQMTGNSGTAVGTNYIGTNDSVPFEIKVNGKQRMMFNINQSCISAGLGNLGKITTGHNNDAWGNYSLANNTTGNFNSALGGHALYNNISGWGNNAHGHEALYSNTTGYSNSAIGDSALYTNTSGNTNLAFGLQSLYSNTTGDFNTAVGFKTLYSNTTASSSTAIGNYAGYSNSADRICLFGDSAGYYNTTGTLMAFGYFAGGSNTTGTHNTFIGNKTGQANTTGSSNTGVGHFAIYNSTADNITAVGDSALFGNTSGVGNTGIGYAVAASNSTGNWNTATGYEALYKNAAGSYNTATGYEALYNNTGTNNTANGYEALFNNTIGSQNTATGVNAMVSNTTGGANTAYGYRALVSNSVLKDNIAIGDSALYWQSYGTTFSSENVAVGNNALFSTNPTATGNGNQNTAMGNNAMLSNTIGANNTANGYSALYATTTGNNNTALGYNALSANTAGSYNTAIGSGANVSFNGFTNATAIGAGATATASNSIMFGNSSVTQVEFRGALMPYYSAAYNAGTVGQVLTSQGAGVSPQWATSLPVNYSHTVFTPSNAGTVNLVDNQTNIINPSGTLIALTVVLPSSPANNDVIFIKYTQAVVTVTYSGGVLADGIVAPTSGTLIMYTYDSGTLSWY